MPANKRVKSQESRVKGKNKKGFTLVELMVTIAIIAVLAAVGLVVYGTAQKAGRISKRIQDLEAIKTALELYKASNGAYPSGDTGTWASSCVGVTLTALVPTYIQTLPADPLDSGNPSGTHCYQYTRGGSTTDYKVRTNPTVNGSEMDSTAFAQQLNLVDPATDGTQDCTVQPVGGTISYKNWAVYATSGIASTNGCYF